jgi:nicotinamidase/pyrazinamidase
MALLIVDVQNDFCPGGALPVKNGDKIVPKLNKLAQFFTRQHLPIFFTRDWHPLNHISFEAQGGPWPAHCVQGTNGAEFHPKLSVPEGAMIINKGFDPKREAYSGFQGTGLAAQLRNLGVNEVLIGGLATDYCVKETALDAMKEGFRVDVLTDCVEGVNVHSRDSKLALRKLSEMGAKLVSSSETFKLAQGGAE